MLSRANGMHSSMFVMCLKRINQELVRMDISFNQVRRGPDYRICSLEPDTPRPPDCCPAPNQLEKQGSATQVVGQALINEMTKSDAHVSEFDKVIFINKRDAFLISSL